ncbi:MAG: GTPase HflX [Myxococcaceae bacterium]
MSLELAKALCHAAADLARMVGVFVDRRGSIQSVILGEQTQLYLPEVGRSRASASRLRGVRLIVAKPRRSTLATYELDRDFITDLEKLHLDCVLQIEVLPDSSPGRCVTGILSAKSRHQTEQYSGVKAIDFDFAAAISELESALARQAPKTVQGAREQAVLVGVYTTPRKQWQASLNELQELARTAKVQVLDTVVQQRKQTDPRTVVGSGKLEELCLHALSLGADMLIFDRDLSPSQLNAITELTDLKILDRTMLILDIFAQRAQSKAGKLQVELAQLQYSLPRLANRQTGLSRLSGGIGGVGPGETKLELDKRRVKDRAVKLEREIDKLCEQRELTRQGRQNKQFPVIALVGYTNAGKSTLMNKLTKAAVYAENALFATLDPTSRVLRLPTGKEVILVDTVGFIRELPKGLISAFRATLEELREADLLLHVVDGSDPECERHVRIVNEILDSLELGDKKRLLVVNKCDLLEDSLQNTMAKNLGGVMVSAQTGLGLSELLSTFIPNSM